MRQWKCKVCGYVHSGDEPPDVCPVCGAPREQFVEVGEDRSESTGTPASSRSGLSGFLARERTHAIAVHIPNGVLPIAVLFLLVGLLLGPPMLGIAAHYNVLVVLLAMPVVVLTGIIDWKAHYGGVLTRVFIAKLVCAAVVLLVSLLAVLWWRRDAAAIRADWILCLVYVCLHLVALSAAVVAGFLGGRLTFGSREAPGSSGPR
jgi:rubredoxin